MSRFVETIPDSRLNQIKHLAIHNWNDHWKCRPRGGYFGTKIDENGSSEWNKARNEIIERMIDLDSCTILIHFAGGGSRQVFRTTLTTKFAEELSDFGLLSSCKKYLVMSCEKSRCVPGSQGHWLSGSEIADWFREMYGSSRSVEENLSPNCVLARAEWSPIEIQGRTLDF